ncbi:hypothetical protein OG21DRAFT_1325093 [Imleria badia]|nr:hypothetical protein OG21DRAFT_1325093 [Imleria badia]
MELAPAQNRFVFSILWRELSLTDLAWRVHGSYSSQLVTFRRNETLDDRNIEDIVKDAYGWLARLYQEGDRIYLFGFSRGAYQVRVLAEMIHEVGLITMAREKLIGTAYDHYEAIRSGKPKARQIAKVFKKTFCWKDMRVHLIGVWESVLSVGLPRDGFLSTSSSALQARHFRHALALDELRVNFMPEYFHEMNSHTDDGKSKYIVTSPDIEHTGEFNVSDNSSDLCGVKKEKTTDIKEVWFAGSHSDVGGRDRPGKSHQAGNVSLLWMRREAAANGLVLEPTDTVWVPDDLDFGIRDSMSAAWKAIEYMPIRHQVSFSGAGEDARRSHQLQPRRIIPGQKVHASVLYATAYKPQATLGEGFDIPIIHSGLEDTELDSQIWETGLFDDAAALGLVTYLGRQQGIAPIYLDRLLFMLRFKEGKQCVRNVPNWENQFMNLIRNRNCAPLVRLVTIVAYYEASRETDVHPKSRAQPHTELSPDVFDDAKNCLRAILAARKHRDGPRMLTLLRPLAKHQILRERILTQDILQALVELLDVVVTQPGGNFGQAMDGLNCLLQCEDTRSTIIAKLEEIPPDSSVSRLSRILEVDDPHLQAAALRMASTLALIPEARVVCSVVMPRFREFASKDDRLVGLVAIKILLTLYDPNHRGRQHISGHVFSFPKQHFRTSEHSRCTCSS